MGHKIAKTIATTARRMVVSFTESHKPTTFFVLLTRPNQDSKSPNIPKKPQNMQATRAAETFADVDLYSQSRKRSSWFFLEQVWLPGMRVTLHLREVPSSMNL